MQKDALPEPEAVWTDQKNVACEGNGAGLGHPRVFYNLEKDGRATCGYCGKTFMLKTYKPIQLQRERGAS